MQLNWDVISHIIDLCPKNTKLRWRLTCKRIKNYIGIPCSCNSDNNLLYRKRKRYSTCQAQAHECYCSIGCIKICNYACRAENHNCICLDRLSMACQFHKKDYWCKNCDPYSVYL